jgi:hypothetical protein
MMRFTRGVESVRVTRRSKSCRENLVSDVEARLLSTLPAMWELCWTALPATIPTIAGSARMYGGKGICLIRTDSPQLHSDYYCYG